MRLLDLTLPTPQQNLALDEALLLRPEASEVLRLWESPRPFVVLGRSSRREAEVDPEACRAAGVSIHRRVSGGATILTGPGCLMYAVVLSLKTRPELRALDRAHEFVLGRMTEGLRDVDPTVVAAGTSDLAIRPHPTGPLLKFSGNSMRVVRDRLLYHGTLLYDADLPTIARLLRTPPRQPDYRESRAHELFLANLSTEAAPLRSALLRAWPTSGLLPMDERLTASVEQLVRERYDREDWRRGR